MVKSRQQPPRGQRRGAQGSRNKDDSICLIVNPRAAAGRAGRRLEQLRQLSARAFEHWQLKPTEGPGHATELAREAVREGFDIVAAVGGDGTCNEVVNGLLTRGEAANADTVFTVIPFGTGSDLIRSLEIPRSTSEALWIASTGVTLRADLGRLHAQGATGEPVERLFINETSFGVSGDVVERVNRSGKRLGGFASFFGATVAAVASYKPPEVQLSWEGPEGSGTWSGELNNAFVANGQYCGGGMRVTRGGSMFDGVFELTVLQPLGLLSSAVNLPRLYRGTADHAAGAFRVPVHSLEARCLTDDTQVLIDLDGEQPGVLPLKVELLPAALQVRGGWLRSPIRN